MKYYMLKLLARRSFGLAWVILFASLLGAIEAELQFEQPLSQTLYTHTIQMCKDMCDVFDLFDTANESSLAWQEFAGELATHVGSLDKQIDAIIAQHEDAPVCSLDDLQYLMDVIYKISRHHKQVFRGRKNSKIGYTKVVLANIRAHLYEILQLEYEHFLKLS